MTMRPTTLKLGGVAVLGLLIVFAALLMHLGAHAVTQRPQAAYKEGMRELFVGIFSRTMECPLGVRTWGNPRPLITGCRNGLAPDVH